MSLRQIRKARGYETAAAFADVMCIPYGTYIRYEQDPTHMPMPQAIRFAEALYTTIGALVGMEYDPMEFTDPDYVTPRDIYSPEVVAILEGLDKRPVEPMEKS